MGWLIGVFPTARCGGGSNCSPATMLQWQIGGVEGPGSCARLGRSSRRGRSGRRRSGGAVPRRRRAHRSCGGGRWCSGGSGQGTGERARGKGCGAPLGAGAHASWGAGALRRAGHGGGEVAAAELAGATWRGEERSSAREGGRRGVWARRVGDHGKQEVAGAGPERRAALDCRRR